jgi:hypothetical protein
MNREREKES